MKKIFFLLIIVFSNTNSFGQKIYDKITKNICKCVSKELEYNDDVLKKCIEVSILDKMNDIVKTEGFESIEDVNWSEVSDIIIIKLFKDCEYFGKELVNQSEIVFPKYEKSENIKCDEIKIGDFYYLMPNQNNKFSDTTYVTFSKDYYLERMKFGKTYSKLKIKWKKACEFELEFIESNDPFKKALSTKGDKYYYQIIDSTPEYFIVSITIHGEDYHMKFIKVD